jgi:hypothetical protein
VCDGRLDSRASQLQVIIYGFLNESAQVAYRESGYTNWALAMEKRFSNE